MSYISQRDKQKLTMNLLCQIADYSLASMAGRPPTRQAPRFGQRLAALRKQLGLSQEALAQLLGTTRDNIAYYERKADNPSLDFIERCAQALRVSPEELITDTTKTRSARPGPPSQLEQRMTAVRQLPRGKQKMVLQFLDAFLRDTQTSKAS